MVDGESFRDKFRMWIFHTFLGPLLFLLVAWGMKLNGPSVSAVATTNVILFVILTLWAWGTAVRRMLPINSLLSSMITGLMVVVTLPPALA
jgi:hypothetical protein